MIAVHLLVVLLMKAAPASAQVTECVGGTKEGPFGFAGAFGCVYKSDGFHKVTFGTTSCQQYVECSGSNVVLYHCCPAGETFDNDLQACVAGDCLESSTDVAETTTPVNPTTASGAVAVVDPHPPHGVWTSQISTSGSAGSELAQDGDVGTCAVTGHHSRPYWAARLGNAATNVSSVTLVGRGVFSNITITVSDTFDANTGEQSGEQLCASWLADRDLTNAHFPCSRPVAGLYLVVSGSPPLQHTSRYCAMALCEVYIN